MPDISEIFFIPQMLRKNENVMNSTSVVHMDFKKITF